MRYNKRMNYIVGIDEAGRGPLAGPVSVGLFGAEKKMEKWLLKNIFDNKLRDSKKLSPKKREEIYKKFGKLQKQKKIFFAVSHVSNKIIDKKGISYAINYAINNLLVNTKRSASNIVRLDGSLKAPPEFKNQKTIIKGDEKDVFIACASIVAKVERDRLMCRLSSKYPQYGLHIHKGYGTALHRSLIKKHGLSPLHRQTFCHNLTK
jgi:ribonuclease HII